MNQRENVAEDSYWYIAEILNTEQDWSVIEHVEFMLEVLKDCNEYLSDIPDEHSGGDSIGIELRKRIKTCLSGVAPGYLESIYNKTF